MRRIFDNLGWKLVSLMLAVFLWFFAIGEPTVTTFESAPVAFRDIPSGLEIVSDVPETVRLEVKGPQSVLERAGSKDIAVVLDLSSVHSPGLRTFTIGQQDVLLPSGVELVRPIPSQIRLRFEQRISVTVPIKIRFSGSAPDGYAVRQAEADPKEVSIAGAENRVRQIDFVETDPIDLTNVVGERTFRVDAFVGDPQIRIESPSLVTVKVVMERPAAGEAPK